ncbi:acyl-CoA dehydrogenase family protein [Desulfobotulus sp.]|uniref:acyl-CoA dehydrogenase family protein n=1 Tax=Desulfobotulus sp. TaxID=1940337 RepID=UPI002A359AAD|nr:acyl-CoA dehydrogenase family protein [Desulfobotulus sp.]MDY0162903.1 acyl-CoA dehydrogenase family protein [Desulfobotulus sp.]
MSPNPFHSLLDFPHTRQDLRILAGNFASHILNDFPDIANSHPMPGEVWTRAGKSGILGIGIPEASGGLGGGYGDIAAVSAEIAFASACPGLALSVLLHHLTAVFAIKGLGTTEQKAALLPRLAAGSLTASLAISEPGIGAHPKGLATRAEKTAEGWRISGKKTFITNAPLAGLFIVMAVTGEEKGKKAFSAFLVPGESAGLEVRDLGPLPFFRPAPHGEVDLHGVDVAHAALLGPEGKAFDMLAKPFRGVEDALMAGAVAGGLAALLLRCCRDLKGLDPLPLKQAMGLSQARIAALSSLACRAAQSAPPSFVAGNLNLAIRHLAADILKDLRAVMAGASLAEDTEILFKDMEKSGVIAANVARIRQEQAGAALLSF